VVSGRRRRRRRRPKNGKPVAARIRPAGAGAVTVEVVVTLAPRRVLGGGSVSPETTKVFVTVYVPVSVVTPNVSAWWDVENGPVNTASAVVNEPPPEIVVVAVVVPLISDDEVIEFDTEACPGPGMVNPVDVMVITRSAAPAAMAKTENEF